eukprot:788245_1
MSKYSLPRFLEKGDYDKGYLQLLGLLTTVGTVSRELFNKTFDKLEPANIKIFVIEDLSAKKIIACCTLAIEQKFIHQCSSVGHIEDVVSDTNIRGKGLGKQITDIAVNYARNYGCYKTILDCADHNVAFYERCGFVTKENQMVIYHNRKKSKI